MKSLHKTNDNAANAIIDPYLAKARKKAWFAKDDIYKGHFTNRDGKRKLIDDVLLPEQDCRCCYCMKLFNPPGDPDATIEHLIPRSTSKGAAFTNYFTQGYAGLNSSNVCHTDDYKAGISFLGQYPHHVAYHNFTIACSSCNNRRGHHFVVFPFLLPDNCQHVIYNRKTGKISWYDDPKLFDGSPDSELTVNIVDLNRPLLKAVRAVWFYGKDHPTNNYSTPDTVHNIRERKELIYNAFGTAIAANPDFDTSDIEAFIALEANGIWNEVLKYNYFGTI